MAQLPRRLLLLGRVVNLATFDRERTLTDQPPDDELTDIDGDLGVVLLPSGEIRAFQLSTGAPLWASASSTPCHRLWKAATALYALCGDKAMAFNLQNGSSAPLSGGQGTLQVAVTGIGVAALSSNATRVTLFDSSSKRRLAERALPELAGTLDAQLLAPEGIKGVCAFGVEVRRSLPNGWRARVGCYDSKLSPLWGTRVTFALPAAARDNLESATSNMIRQAGPHFLVLDGQGAADELRSGLHNGRGVLLRWSDGAVVPFDDGTYATIEDQAGQRFTSPEVTAVLGQPGDPSTIGEREGGPLARQADVVYAGPRRAFAVIVNGGAALVGIDRGGHGRVLFRVPLEVGAGPRKLEVVASLPVVRAEFALRARRWRASIHDPSSGRVLYADERSLP